MQHFKMQYIYAMEYYSVLKGNKAGSFVEMWIELKFVIQSKVIQKEKNCVCLRACI